MGASLKKVLAKIFWSNSIVKYADRYKKIQQKTFSKK